jgi:hypothetical protein
MVAPDATAMTAILIVAGSQMGEQGVTSFEDV